MVEASALFPLPPYDIFRFAREYPYALSIVVAGIVVFISTILWKYFYLQNAVNEAEEEQTVSVKDNSDDMLNEGCFNSDTLKNIRRLAKVHETKPETVEESACRKTLGPLRCDDTEGDDELEMLGAEKRSLVHEGKSTISELKCSDIVGNDDSMTVRITRISQAKDVEPDEDDDIVSAAAKRDDSRRKSITEELVEDKEVLGSLGTLHGKLATADINLKARKIEENMTEDERKEEELVCQQQLESIFSIMAADKNRYGLNNESDLMDQMKLYSFRRSRRDS